MEFLTYRHVVNMGDLISSLAGIRHLWKTTGKKAIIYQQLNRPGEYYEGAIHPTKDGSNNPVCFNDDMFSMMRPLLLAQEYIEDFRIWAGEKVDYDLDVVRLQYFCGAPHYPLHKWTWMAYPELACSLSVDWINAHPADCIDLLTEKGERYWWQAAKGEGHKRIIINFTDRYRNYNINYFFLKNYSVDNIVFAGTESEYKKFCNQWGLNIKRLLVTDFEELASALKGSRFVLGNQSFVWHLAQAMYVPRVLELDPCFQNCTSFGTNGYEAYHQHAIEYYVNKLYNE